MKPSLHLDQGARQALTHREAARVERRIRILGSPALWVRANKVGMVSGRAHRFHTRPGCPRLIEPKITIHGDLARSKHLKPCQVCCKGAA